MFNKIKNITKNLIIVIVELSKAIVKDLTKGNAVDYNHTHDKLNPSTGLKMKSNVDIAGNPYGSNNL